MLVKGFEYLPAMGIAYNHAYYPKLMEQLGFDTETDYLSGFATRTNYQLPARVEEMAEKILKRGKFWVKTFTSKSEMQDMIPIVDKIHTEAFENNPAYYPSTKPNLIYWHEALFKLPIRV